MAAVGVDADVDVMDLLDFSPVLPCEGECHDRGIIGHTLGAPGAFLVVSPCCGPSIVQCASRVARMRAGDVISCSRCKVDRRSAEYRFVPVEEGRC